MELSASSKLLVHLLDNNISLVEGIDMCPWSGFEIL